MTSETSDLTQATLDYIRHSQNHLDKCTQNEQQQRSRPQLGRDFHLFKDLKETQNELHTGIHDNIEFAAKYYSPVKIQNPKQLRNKYKQTQRLNPSLWSSMLSHPH